MSVVKDSLDVLNLHKFIDSRDVIIANSKVGVRPLQQVHEYHVYYNTPAIN